MRSRVAGAAVAAVASALLAGCGGGAGGVITIAGVETPQSGARAAFHVPTGAKVVHAGPGAVHAVVAAGGDRIRISLAPNRSGRRNVVTVSVRRAGRVVRGARVRLDAGMFDMAMGVAGYGLSPRPAHRAVLPVWGMPGRWGLGFTITAPGARPIRVVVDDRMRR
jgi:hypothetical protein